MIHSIYGLFTGEWDTTYIDVGSNIFTWICWCRWCWYLGIIIEFNELQNEILNGIFIGITFDWITFFALLWHAYELENGRDRGRRTTVFPNELTESDGEDYWTYGTLILYIFHLCSFSFFSGNQLYVLEVILF